MTAPYANAVVQATLKWDDIDAEFERNVVRATERAVKAAQKHLDRIKLAADVHLDADTGKFRQVTQSILDRASLTADVRLRADTGLFHADVRNAVKGLADAKVKVTLDSGAIQPFVADIENRLRAAKITAPVFLEVANEAQFRAHIAQLTQPVTQHVIIQTHGGGGGGGGGGSFGPDRLSLSLGKVASAGLKTAGIASLIGAIGGAAGLAAGAVGVLGVGLAGVAAAGTVGIGTTVLALQGVGDAFSALGDAATSAGPDAAAQAKAVTAAERGLEQAHRGVETANRRLDDSNQGLRDSEKDVLDAKKDVLSAERDLTTARKDATRQIEDLNFALKGTAIDERDAELAVARAREAYDKAFSDPKASALDRAEAALGVDKALRRQEETLRRNTDLQNEAAEANTKGVAGSDQVVAAKERLVDANDQVAVAERGVRDAQRDVTDAQRDVADAHRAVTDAEKELQDALTGTSSGADKAAQALAKLSPNARDFVLAMMATKPVFDDLKNAVQDAVFADLGAVYSDLAKTVLPQLKDGLTGVGGAINGAAKDFAAFFSQPEAIKALNAIFAGTADLITSMQPGLAQLTAGLLDLGQAAAPAMGMIGESLGGLVGTIGQVFTDAFESGALTQLFETFSTVIDGLAEGLGPLLTALIDLGNVVGPVLGPLFETLGESLAALGPSLGQLGVAFGEGLIEVLPVLSQFISMIADGLTPIMPILADLLVAVGNALMPLIPPLSEILQVVGIALVDAVNALAPAIGPLGEAFAALVSALAPILPLVAEVIGMLVTSLAPALTTIFNAFAPVITQLVEQLRPVFDQLAPILADVAMQIGTVLAAAITQLTPIFPTLIDGFSRIIAAIAPFLPQLLTIWADYLPKLIELFIYVVDNVLPPLVTAFEWLARNVFPLVVDAIRIMADTLGDRFTTIKTVLQDAKDFIGGAVDGMRGFFEGLGSAVSIIWDGIVNAIKRSVGVIGNIIKGAGSAIKWAPGRHGEDLERTGKSLVDWSNTPTRATGGAVSAGRRANGLLYGPGTGISDSILALGADGMPTARVSAGEWVTPEAAVNAKTLPVLEALRRGWVPSSDFLRAMVFGGGLPGYASGGVVGSFQDLAAQYAPGLTLTSAERSTNDYHGQGMAVDYSNGSGNSDEQLAWANFLADNYQSQLAELIYSDPRFTRNIKDGKIVAASFYGADIMAQHENHVHAAATSPLGAPSDAAPGPDESGQAGAPDTRTNKQRYVDEIVAEGRRRGISDKGIKTAIAAMLAESDGVMYANESDADSMQYAHDAVSTDYDSSGLFQQRNNGAWGTAADRMDPARSAGMFYDQLAKHDYENMDPAAAAQAVQRSAFADGSNYQAKMTEAADLYADSDRRQAEGAAASASSPAASPGAAGTQDVRVTNWPSGLGATGSAVTSAASTAAFASGASIPPPVVVSAAAAGVPSTAFDPNNTGYDDSYYDDQIARGGVDGANAWLARQDFQSQANEWGLNALKEVGGQFAEPVGLDSAWGGLVDRSAASLAAPPAPRGDTTINNTFVGYQGTPQQMIAEWERSLMQRMAPVADTFRNG
ncbi:phage tail protein [Rhodococcus sp. NPDC055112]